MGSIRETLPLPRPVLQKMCDSVLPRPSAVLTQFEGAAGRLGRVLGKLRAPPLAPLLSTSPRKFVGRASRLGRARKGCSRRRTLDAFGVWLIGIAKALTATSTSCGRLSRRTPSASLAARPHLLVAPLLLRRRIGSLHCGGGSPNDHAGPTARGLGREARRSTTPTLGCLAALGRVLKPRRN